MLTTREVIKTFYNALLQRLKKHRGDWNQNDPSADDYIKNRPFYTDDTKKVIKLDKKYLPDIVATKSEVETVKTAADNAQTTANDAKTAADNAQTTANDAKTAADNAQTTANDAKTAADNAVRADVVKGDYKLRIGEKKYVDYGFAILHNDSVLMNYTNTGIYDEYSGSCLVMSGQSVFKNALASQRKIVITVNADGSSEENAITLYGSNGQSTSISADGVLDYSGHVIKIGSLRHPTIVRYVDTPEEEYDAATKGYVDGKISDTEIFLNSSTADSTKRFRITVDDSGALTTEAVTE